MKSILSLIVFSIFFSLFSVSAKAQIAVKKSSDILTANQITGAWRINNSESDNPLLKMQTFLQNKLPQSADEKQISVKKETLPMMSISLVPPETLILAGDDQKSITINEGFSEIVFTRTFATDGETRSSELSNGTIFSMTALRNENFLKVETVSPRGNKMVENYAISNEGKKLIVTVRFEDAEAKEMLTLRRVYDRAFLNILSGDADDIQ